MAAVAWPQVGAGPVVTSLTLFAGTSGGLWRSTDWGQRWDRAEGKPEGDSLKGVGAVHSILPVGTRVYLGTDTGLLLSDDFGQTWKRSELTKPVLAVMPSRYPLSDPTVFAGTAEGLFRSRDGGRTFAPTPLAGTPVTRMEWPGPALVVASGRGVWISMNAADTFQGPGEGLPPGAVGALAVSSFFAADPVLFAAVGAQGVVRSQDGGRTWKPSGLDGISVSDLVWLGPILYAATERGLFRSETAGGTWSPLGEGLAGAVPVRFLFPLAPASGAEAFLATDRGLFRTADGGLRWIPSGLAGEAVLAVGTFPPADPVRRGRRR
jgi:ligand-binding sensor domain-containing protein